LIANGESVWKALLIEWFRAIGIRIEIQVEKGFLTATDNQMYDADLILADINLTLQERSILTVLSKVGSQNFGKFNNGETHFSPEMDSILLGFNQEETWDTDWYADLCKRLQHQLIEEVPLFTVGYNTHNVAVNNRVLVHGNWRKGITRMFSVDGNFVELRFIALTAPEPYRA